MGRRAYSDNLSFKEWLFCTIFVAILITSVIAGIKSCATALNKRVVERQEAER